MPEVPRLRRPTATACAGLQPGHRLALHIAARGYGRLVVDQPTIEADQDRGLRRAPRPRYHLPIGRGCRHRPDGARHPRRYPPITSATVMRVTAIQAEIERKRQDRSVRHTEKRRRRDRKRGVRGLIRPSSAACATAGAAQGKIACPTVGFRRPSPQTARHSRNVGKKESQMVHVRCLSRVKELFSCFESITKKAYFVIIFSIFGVAISNEGTAQETLMPLCQGGLCGYYDGVGEIVIPLKFDEAKSFNDGLAVVRSKRHWGALNLNGELVIPAQYEDLQSFENGLSIFKLNRKYGVVDTQGNVVIEPADATLAKVAKSKLIAR